MRHWYSVKWKIMAVIIALSFILIVLGMLLYKNMFVIIEQQSIDNTAQSITKAGNGIDSLILSVDNAILPLLYDRDVLALYDGDPGAQAPVESKIARAISSFRDDNIALLMVNRSTKIIASSQRELISQYRILGMQWINKIHRANGGLVLISGYTVNRTTTGDVEKVMCLAHSVRDGSGTTLGYLIAEIPVSLLGSICEKITLNKEGYIAVIDNDNYVLYSTKDGLTGSQQTLAPTGSECEQDYFYRTVNGIPNLVTNYRSTGDSLAVMGFVPVANVDKEAKQLRERLMVAVCAASLLVLLYAYGVSNSITKPLVQLQTYMQRVEQGDFSARIRSKRRDEIGALERGFDSMNEQLGTMHDLVTSSQLREKEARFQSLVSAINPHFLYNTLESISMTAYMNNDFRTVELLQHFADLLRYSANMEAQDISVAGEIQYIKDYLFLQQNRQPGLFDVCWNVDEELQDHRMLRFLLQPIVENSIRHGFCDMKKGGILEIGVFSIGSFLVCQVRDNGAGIPDDRYEELVQALSDRVTAENAFALTNIHERIQLAYGPDYGLEIQNHSPGSCVIELHLPLLMPETEK